MSSATYDTLGKLTQLSGPLGGVTNYSYDNMGRLTAESTASGGTVSYGYNELHIKAQLTNARGQVRKYFYDVMGRITSCVGVEDSVSYTYDANGNVLTVTDSHGTITREYDALNRVTKYTDTYGKSICYEYDAVGNLERMVYPDNTVVTYTYDANNNLVSVSDWANRVTAYTYDVNNRVIGVTKPDGSVTTTVYDNKQRVTSSVERTASGTIITGFEYVYDALGRISEESRLANNTKVCYTYDNLSRVTKRTITDLNSVVISEESFAYDAAGNLLSSADCCEGQNFAYDSNNRLTAYNGQTVSYDLDGNMLSAPLGCECTTFEYDSANRLIRAGEHAYTYNAEDVRIRNLCCESDTTYVYNTNAKLSQMLQKTTNSVVTKYVYGLGLIGEEKSGVFKTYHFDYRGSTVAITDMSGNVTDTFEYDTYGRVTSRTGNSEVIFGYNGRDGVVTDENELIYMRARYYAPELRRFVNADVIPGEISNAVTLNRYAYANGNPVMNVDPFGLSAERNVEKSELGIINFLWSFIARDNSKMIKKLKKDFENYDINNESEEKVLEANYFSAYKETLVIKTPLIDAPFSFGIIVLTPSTTDANIVKHEYGHKVQFDNMGIINYTFDVAIPSVTINMLDRIDKLKYDYYGAPWEAEADELGGVNREKDNTPWPEGTYDSYWDLIKMFLE